MAAQLCREPDGTYRRSDLASLAGTYGIPLGTVRRWLDNASLPYNPHVLANAQAVRAADAAEAITAPTADPALNMLVAVAANAGNKKNAHAWAIDHFNYSHGYRQFLRDLEKLDPALLAGAISGYKSLLNARVYMTTVIPHRNHTWVTDHTKADLWVLPDRGNVPFRPWITMVVDGSTDVWMAVEAWEGNLNTERFTQALTRAAVGDAVVRGATPTIGGLPAVVVFDNAREHLADAIEEGCLRLGVVASPTTPYHSWENGRAEVSHANLAKGFLSTLPGYSKGGVNQQGRPRFLPAGLWSDVGNDPDESVLPLLRMSRFITLLEEYRVKRNQTATDMKGLTPEDKWHADTTAITVIDGDVMLANLTVTSQQHTVNKAGIRFRNEDYVSVELGPYRKKTVTVRYLPTVKDWIEVFDGDTYIGRAWLATRLPTDERSRITVSRARQEKQFRAVEHAAQQHRAHVLAAVQEGCDPESLPASPPLISALTAPEAEPDREGEPARSLPTVGPIPRGHAPASRDDAWTRLEGSVLADDFILDPRAHRP
jgi:hypothetical protein